MNKLRTQMRWIMIIIVVAFLLSTFLMYGSSSRSGGSNAGGGDYAVAEINGRNIMASELYQHLMTHMEGSPDRELTSMDYQVVLEEFAIDLQMAQEVRDSGITVTDAEVDQSMKEYVDQVFPTREAFYQYLERSGTTLEDYKQQLSQQMVAQKFVEESVGTTVVSDDEAVQFYDSMKGIFFTQPAGYMANLARFSSRDEASKVRALLSGGRPWNEATSHDVVASSDIIYVTEEPVYFPDMTFDGYLSPMKSADIGVITPVFEIASNDFAVGVKGDRVEEKVTSYDEVSADVRLILQQQKQQEVVYNFRTGLLSRADIVILDTSLFPQSGPDFQPVTTGEPADAPSGVPVSTDVSVPSTASLDVTVTSGD